MAITQISKIQIRTGNNTDLPVLAPGELGYSTDTKQLYVGNVGGALPTDNTQILSLPATVATAVDTTISHKIPVVINGITYYLALTSAP